MSHIHSSIYAQSTNNPFVSWLEAATEKRVLEQRLRDWVPGMRIARVRDRQASVLDYGCGWGDTSFRLMRVLKEYRVSFDYTGVDPHSEQLLTFHRLVDGERPYPRLVVGGIETFEPDQPYDLVFASHALYYVPDMAEAVQRIVNAGHEAIIVHHGQHGINLVHECLRRYVRTGPHIISTDADVERCLKRCNLRGRTVTHHTFQSEVDVSGCVDPDSQHGRNLLSFFLERPYESLEPEALAAARNFIEHAYGTSDYRMRHDIGVFIIS